MIVVGGGNELSPVYGVGVFVNHRRTPGGAPNARPARLRLLRDVAFPGGPVGGDAGAQQRKPGATVGGKKQIGIGGGERTAHPGGGCAETVNALLLVGKIHRHRSGIGRHADKLNIVHPQDAWAGERTGPVINVQHDIGDIIKVGVRIRVQRDAYMHPVGVAGGDGHASGEIVLAIRRRAQAKLEVAEIAAAVHGGTGGKPDVALQIGELNSVDGGIDAVNAVPNGKLFTAGAGKIEQDLHRTGSGVGIGIAGRIPGERLKGIAEPVAPDAIDSAAGISIGADSSWIEPVNHIGHGLRLCRRQKAAGCQQEHQKFQSAVHGQWIIVCFTRPGKYSIGWF